MNTMILAFFYFIIGFSVCALLVMGMSPLLIEWLERNDPEQMKVKR